MTGAPGLSARFHGRLGKFSLDVAFTAPARGITALFGPSGCGKTTVLRCVAGLQHLPDGHLDVAGEVWQDGRCSLAVHRRPIGYVFQEASLFPHLSVRANLLYGQRRALRNGGAATVPFDETVALLGLERLLDRSPKHLSGGERQRVSVGRALQTQPRLLLMDEPLSALDRFSKDEILPYLEALHDTLSIPVLYVSHDIAEVERLADHLVLLRAGAVLAAGPLQDLQANPALPLAGLPDAGVVLQARVRDYDTIYGLTTLDLDGGTLTVPGRIGETGRPWRVRVLASDVSLARERAAASSILNILPAHIAETDGHHGVMVTVALRLAGGHSLLARITRRSWDLLRLNPGDPVFAQVKSVALLDQENSEMPS